MRFVFCSGMEHPVGILEKLARGVYWSRATKGGKSVVYAVDSAGDAIKRLVLQDDSIPRANAAIEYLWNYLDVVDPAGSGRPQLRLVTVRQLPSTERSAVAEPLDPYNLPPLPGRRNVWG